MRFLELNLTGFKTPEATTYIRCGDRVYFNYRFGLKRYGFSEYRLTFSYKDFKPNSITDVMTLDKDNYIILPITKNDKDQYNKNNQKLYCVYEDKSKSHTKDTILFWEIPNRNYTNIEYRLEGDVSLLAQASTGLVRNEKTFKTPILMLDVYGSCELHWEANNYLGDKVSQTITYSYEDDRWDLESIKTTQKG